MATTSSFSILLENNTNSKEMISLWLVQCSCKDIDKSIALFQRCAQCSDVWKANEYYIPTGHFAHALPKIEIHWIAIISDCAQTPNECMSVCTNVCSGWDSLSLWIRQSRKGCRGKFEIQRFLAFSSILYAKLVWNSIKPHHFSHNWLFKSLKMDLQLENRFSVFKMQCSDELQGRNFLVFISFYVWKYLKIVEMDPKWMFVSSIYIRAAYAKILITKNIESNNNKKYWKCLKIR